MAKKKSFNNLSPKKTPTKPTNEDIDSILSEKENKTSTKQKLVQFNVKLPKNLYNALDAHSNKTGLSKKAIVVQALLNLGLMDT